MAPSLFSAEKLLLKTPEKEQLTKAPGKGRRFWMGGWGGWCVFFWFGGS